MESSGDVPQTTRPATIKTAIANYSVWIDGRAERVSSEYPFGKVTLKSMEANRVLAPLHLETSHKELIEQLVDQNLNKGLCLWVL